MFDCETLMTASIQPLLSSACHAPIAALDPPDALSSRLVTIISYVFVIGGVLYACSLFVRWLWDNFM